METKKENQLLTAKDLAKILSTSVRSIWRYQSSGRLPKTIKIAGAIRWKKSDIDLWIAMNCPSMKEFQTRKEAQDEK